MTPAISLSSAVVDRAGTHVVRGVDMAVARGAWFGLIGANGSGKTSLLRAIAGRLPFAGGACLLDGVDRTADRFARAASIGFAPPADKLPEAMRAGELLALVAGDQATAESRLGALGTALGIAGLRDRWIGDCSAGMRQRIAVALAFAGGQSLVILDEPFNWLDPVAAFDLRAALAARVREGLTLITALHDLATLALACDAGAMLAEGRVALKIDSDMLAEAARDLPGFEQRAIGLLRGTLTD